MDFFSRANPIIVIAGPTASGKSELAVNLSLKLREQNIEAEILCADSITVYKGFEIGAAKPNDELKKLVPHHLLDICNADQNFTAGSFTLKANALIAKLHANKKVPILVGGTGFYIRALIQGMAEEAEEDKNEVLKVKASLEERAKEEGYSKLYQEMLSLDPSLKIMIHENDHYRIIRALQAMKVSGTRWSELNAKAKNSAPKYENSKYFCINIPRDVLRERVIFRTKKMLSDGLVEEVKNLLADGVPPNAKPMQSVGYKECVVYLQSEKPSITTLEENIVRETMRLAKRQNTWFRGEKNVIWLPIEKEENLCTNMLNSLNER